jgi:RHS repeat-associated protein
VASGPAYSPYGTGNEGVLVTQYDVFGRAIATGWKAVIMSSANRGSLQQQVNAGTDPFPLTPEELLTRNYYDNYNFPGGPNPVPDSIEEQLTATNVKGLSTGSWTRVLTTGSTTDAEVAYTIYDHRYRPVRSYTSNYLGGYTQSDSKLDFEGKTLYTITTHKRTAADTELRTTETFTYSPQGRLLTHTHQIGEGPVELLAAHQYDELGQLIAKRVGGGDTGGTTGLQKVDYSYNIRGWLRGINNTDNLNNSGDPADLFSFKITYNNPTMGQPLFNGNISETFWRTGNDNVLRQYTYQYDPLNRLLDAAYSKPGVSINNSYGENLSYDANGNIMTLTRYGELDDNLVKRKIDGFTYDYDTHSNRLASVTDVEEDPSGFSDGTITFQSYGYDVNGNLISDSNKGIRTINYNHLNLPVTIQVQNGGDFPTISYIYNARGAKVGKVVETAGRRPVTTTTDYLNGYQYENRVLQFFPTAEGYVKSTAPVRRGDNRYSYVYNYTDHLGNVRLSYENNNNVLTVLEEDNYYPFGMKHNGYNSVVNGYNPGGKIKFQGRELQEEFGLNVYPFKYRTYDPAIGRFWSVDPVAESYVHNGAYNFAENRVIESIDLEGKESWFAQDGSLATKAGPYTSQARQQLNLYSPSEVQQAKAKAYNSSGPMLSQQNRSAEDRKAQKIAITAAIAEKEAITQKLDNHDNYGSPHTANSVMQGAAYGAVDYATGAVLGKAFQGIKMLGRFSTSEVSAFSKIGSTGKVGEDALKLLGGESQVYMKTSEGGRFIDQLVNGVANESKVGYTTLTKDITTQIAKDAEIVTKGTGGVKEAVWHFFTSPVTGKGGASQPLLDELAKNGIKAVIH